MALNQIQNPDENEPIDTSAEGPMEPSAQVLPATTDAQVAAGNTQNPGAPLRADSDFLSNSFGGQRQEGVTSNNVVVSPTFDTAAQMNQVALQNSAAQAAAAQQKGLESEATENKATADQASGEAQGQVDNATSLENFADLQKRLKQSSDAFDLLEQKQNQFLSLPNQGIDPTRYVNSLGVSGQTLTALGMVVGGFGAGLTGGPNLAVQTFQQKVQNDIQAQTVSNQQQLLGIAQAQGIAMGRVELAGTAATAQAMAQHTVLTGIAATSQYQMLHASSQKEYDAASAVNFQAQQALGVSTNNYANTYKNFITSHDNKNMGLGAAAAEDLAGKFDLKGAISNVLHLFSPSNSNPQNQAPSNSPAQPLGIYNK